MSLPASRPPTWGPNRVVGVLETVAFVVSAILGVIHQVDAQALTTWPALLSALFGFVFHAGNHGPGGTV